jgi:lipopolysaccharide export LptBFGC system permease protein LptF
MLVIMKIAQAGDNLYTLACVALGCASFHFSTLEEYYTGGLFLGPFNAISDGSIVYIVLNILMAIIGN